MVNLFSCYFSVIMLLLFITRTSAIYDYCSGQETMGTEELLCLKLRPGTEGPYGRDIQNVVLHTTYYTEDILNIQFLDSDSPRWQVPDIVLLHPQNIQANSSHFKVEFFKNNFGFAVHRLDQTDPIFLLRPSNGNRFQSLFSNNSGDNPFIFEDQYLELTTQIGPDPVIYGLGERIAPLRLPLNQTFSIFTKDLPTPKLDNIYGAHPFYIEIRDGKAHGILLLNSNGMDVTLGHDTLTYQVMGGIFDFFFFQGPTPQLVIQQYLSLIGRPYFPPYWSLGFHQSRYGYKDVDELMQVVDQYARAKIPLDAIWSDIDYMDGCRDFTNDPMQYPQPGLATWIDQLHQQGQKYVIIIDPGIKVDPHYQAYKQGIKDDIFIKNQSGGNLLGRVWPGYVHFPDFFNPKIKDYWFNQLSQYHERIPFDGIWIDMNEVSNFCDGECHPIIKEQVTCAKCDFSQSWHVLIGNLKKESSPVECIGHEPNQLDPIREEPTQWNSIRQEPIQLDSTKFNPINGHEPIEAHTISLDAVQFISTVYNTHNLYGHSESKISHQVMSQLSPRRPFILTRSSFVGTGRYASHWLGDNHASWDALRESIAGSITMGLFGIPLIGADICGFLDDTTPELCARWIQLGSFYPFTRNHNDIHARSQEFYCFGQEVVDIARQSIETKYLLLPYYYTLLYESHTLGDPVMRGLFYEFVNDPNVLDNDRQFMIGRSIMVIPVLGQGMTHVDAYLPGERWYDFYSGQSFDAREKREITLEAPLSRINVLLRGSSIIPLQTPSLTTRESRLQPFQLIVLLDTDQRASGSLYLDDGESVDSVDKETFTRFEFKAEASQLMLKPIQFNYTSESLLIDQIIIRGIQHIVEHVYIDHQPLEKESWIYIQKEKTLKMRLKLAFLLNKKNTNINWA